MTLDILHFRTGLLALNLLSAVGLPAYAALSYWRLGDGSGSLEYKGMLEGKGRGPLLSPRRLP